ncbi:WXG100 family type VII secretion target [Streptomyces sp. P38-E01]|uniref:WXG100 family type VII secretion target n=1 Tax=Streptomyces tardus TaxID=2780544 RepID=A0A949JM49_9ACTN|nr:WXG100 family type VII secretion target [Streptomyces tardus]MBU7596680.1 WXG100 family type VII secretion target [Streptomyces tardus]
MGVGAQAGDALSRVSYALDWSNPLASTLDEIIRGILKQFNVDELLEQVSGDVERLAEVATEWRVAARDLRGVVDDLQAERNLLNEAWKGPAAKGFGTMMNGFEKALLAEAEDMETIAQLLEMAAKECAAAEKLMLDLVVEIVQAVIASAATTAILGVLTAGAAAAIGPIIAGANIAYRVARGARITARLAERLADLARRMQAMRKLAKVRHELRKGPKHFKGGLKRFIRPEEGQARDPMDLVRYAAYRQAKGVVKAGVHETLGVDRTGAVTGVGMEEGPGIAERRIEYRNRPGPESFDERTKASPDHAKKTVREAFG